MATRAEQQRDKAIKRLLELAPQMLFGSSSQTYRTCGNKSCRCHSSGPKHGPHVYVNYKGEDGRTTGYYVPQPLQERVQEGLAAWREFYALSKEIAEINRQLMAAERPRRRGDNETETDTTRRELHGVARGDDVAASSVSYRRRDCGGGGLVSALGAREHVTD